MAEVFRFPATPPPPPPTNELRATLFTVIGPSGRPLSCAAYDVETGLEVRLFYGPASPLTITDGPLYFPQF